MTDAQSSTCVSSTDWRELPGSTISLTLRARCGTVGFSRLNTTIQTCRLANELYATNTTAAQLRAVFDALFSSTGSDNDDAAQELASLLGSLTGFLGSSGGLKMAPITVAS